jgi:hypothetical protein
MIAGLRDYAPAGLMPPRIRFRGRPRSDAEASNYATIDTGFDSKWTVYGNRLDWPRLVGDSLSLLSCRSTKAYFSLLS